MATVNRRQESSYDCFVCGANNPLGFKARFYETDSNEVICLALPKEEYQSYPQRMHGGISATLLDETMGRAIMIYEPHTMGVTVDMQIQYKKPVPLSGTLRVIGRIDSNRHIFTASGEIILEDGSVAATATGRYMKMPVNKIADNVDSASDVLFMSEVEREIISVSADGPLEIVYE